MTTHVSAGPAPASLLALAALLSGGCGGSTASPVDSGSGAVDAAIAPDAPDRQAAYRAFADQVAASLAASGVPGGAIAIVQDGKLAFVAGVGVRRAGGTEPVGPDTSFRIGSLSKTFAATAILALAADQILVLDEPITTYVPDLALYPGHDPSRITTRALLSHTAGIPDHFELTCPTGAGAIGEWFAAHRALTLWSPPGRLWSYSNLGFSLAALVAERAAGMPYRELVERRVLGPLGLSSTTYDTDVVVARGDYAVGSAAGGQTDATLTRCALSEPPGYLYSTARDLGRFTEAFLAGGGDVLEAAVLLQLGSAQRSTELPADAFYGLGTFIRPYKGTSVIYHGGDLPGFHTSWVTVPERGFGVAVLVNGDGANPGAFSQQAIDTFLGLPAGGPPSYATPPSTWGRYAGSYASPDEPDAFPPAAASAVVVALEGEHLTATLDGVTFPLTQLAGDSFGTMVGPVPIVLTFWLDPQGRAEYISTRIGAVRRVDAPSRAAAGGARASGPNLFERLAELPAAERHAFGP